MPKVPETPSGLMYHIPITPDHDAGTMNFPTVEITETRGQHGPVKTTRPPKIPKQPSITITLQNCSWCGQKCAGDIHPQCEEIRERMRATKKGESK